MYSPKTIYTKLAFLTIECLLKEKNSEALLEFKNESELNEKQACFVSIHKNGNLRGCIGTIMPVRASLYEEIIGNSISSASKDSRFSPLTLSELSEIDITVDVLSEPIIINSMDELDIKKYGVIVSDGKYKRGVLLPNLDGVSSVEEQLFIAKSKAGLNNVDNSKLTIYRFTSTRYE